MAGTVIVYCKLPNGLIIEVGDKRVRLNGWSKYAMATATRSNLNKDIEAGGGITVVDKDFWDKWYSEHKWFAPVKNGLLYSGANRGEAIARAKDTDSAACSPIDPVHPGGGIQATDETLREVQKTKLVQETAL